MHTIVAHCFKKHLIRLRTLGEETFCVTQPPSENCE